MVDLAATTSYTYDQFGDVLTKKQTVGATTLTVSYSYFANVGLLSGITYPFGAITYSYDSSGRLNSISPGVASAISYFPFGIASSWTEGNASTYVRGFDQDGRITSVTFNSTTTNVQTLTYRQCQPHHGPERDGHGREQGIWI